MEKLKQHKFLLPITILLLSILNIIQGSYTELLPDEAYYWVYSQDMNWGFFDHPPFVAVWVTISNFLFTDELGVRFFSAISFSLMLYLVWFTIDHPSKNKYSWLFLLLFLSTALLNVYGFITTPDTPLLFFFALFLWSYKLYLNKKSTLIYFILSIAITGMMYSKYQGILVIFFIFLSNWKLVKDYKIWLVCFGALILYMPHIYWQYINDFPSIRYHLYERASVATYKFEYTLMHIVNAIAILGFTFIIIYKAFFKGIKSNDIFHRGLNSIVLGFFFFFLISSFRGHVQAQWIAPIMLPLILITFNYLIEHKKNLKLFCYLALTNIAIISFVRISIANEGIIPVKLDFHGNKQWTLEVKRLTKNSEKLFVNSFQNASIYWFYTKEKSHYQKNYLGRKNQYGYIPGNDVFSSDSIAYITRISKEYSEIKMKSSGKDSIFISFLKDYKPLFDLEINFENSTNIEFNTSMIKSYTIIIDNPYTFDINTKDIEVQIAFQNKKGNEKYSIPTKIHSTTIKALSKQTHSLELEGSLIRDIQEYPIVGIGIKTSQNMDLVKVSSLNKFKIVN
ncbi:MAG: glycosyltransferase family 39 protein [Flavobacteriaceae bacterium]|nr:glycosyltransferase family 39 protein [Flavobacteriaceae bacterium]